MNAASQSSARQKQLLPQVSSPPTADQTEEVTPAPPTKKNLLQEIQASTVALGGGPVVRSSPVEIEEGQIVHYLESVRKGSISDADSSLGKEVQRFDDTSRLLEEEEEEDGGQPELLITNDQPDF